MRICGVQFILECAGKRWLLIPALSEPKRAYLLFTIIAPRFD